MANYMQYGVIRIREKNKAIKQKKRWISKIKIANKECDSHGTYSNFIHVTCKSVTAYK